MDETIPDKNFFRIGEVSKILQVEPYVVRYWESEFKTVKPVRTSADQRLYRRRDVEELLMIRTLLYKEGFTIAGARKRLLEIRREKDEEAPADYRDLLLKVRKGLRELKDFIG
jgi:DNA-binding transcriptional MerR regulator